MKYALTILFLLINVTLSAQQYVLDSIEPTLGSLINREANTFKMASESPAFNQFFAKLDSIYSGKKDKLHIFHIGGSHIQADIYSNKIRTYLQNTNEVSQGQRGFVFPYHLAHTNNPSNYRISANRDLWQGYRCSIRKDSIAWGLAGVTAALRVYEDTIYLKSNHRNYTKKPYDFNKLRLFYNTWKNDYEVNILDEQLEFTDTLNLDKMYREYRFSSNIDSLALQVRLKDTTAVNPEFALMGVEFMNDNEGIEYTSIGVNGASFDYYQRAAYFEKQLDLYKPDLFIISIGTNDAYMPKSRFDAEKFRANYEAFIQMIQRINPECAILLTVPNDDYYRRKYLNYNTAIQQEIIMQLARKYHMAVWDFYEIMGGLGSSNKWYKNKLMPRDRIHFTYLGYNIKADLFMDAMIDAWANSTNRDKEELLTHYHNLDE
ncbi:GDSL-type esterase/lipase family protein [Subsaxibacter sp. CAU 1640]|uniref:GDSL-type esterase/lipase family protein n=1 Tax=Subsaxibacter sp. CAU 1640 TaxID=2933271 RepID=UPI0020044CB5|nr:GDSL-type esterase/lipase family protein [Subsaxibacter sp. CAU 1640]MCK7590581.1 GDSL-type esterase/lipase family protein [Subsaxibacter sp. CAU 1640]